MLRAFGFALILAAAAVNCGCPGDAHRRSARPPVAAPAHARVAEPHPVVVASQPVATPAANLMFRGDAARTGRTPVSIPAAAPAVRWRFATGRPIFSTPAVDGDGTLYVGSLDGNVYSLSPAGALRWKRDLGDRVYASPLLTTAGVVVGSDADRMFLLGRQDGRVLWRFSLGPCAAGSTGVGVGPESVRCDADSSPALAADGTIVFGGDALYALRPDGALRWRASLVGHAFSSPAIDAVGNLYIGSQTAMASFDSNGNKRWEHRGLYDFDATPAVTASGLVVAGCDDGRIYAWRASDGQQVWVRATRGPVVSSAAVAPDGTIVVGSEDGQVRALRPDGSLRWSFATKGPIRGSPLVDSAGRVLVGSQDDSLYALDASGKLLWSLQLGGDLDSSPVLAPDGTILVGCDDGSLYAVR